MIKQLQAQIADLDQHRAALQAEIAIIYAGCRERISRYIWNNLNIDASSLVDGVGKGSSYINAANLNKMLFGAKRYDVTKEQWDEKIKELVDAGLIQVIHWFADEEERHSDLKLDEDTYAEVVNPTDGQYFDPIYGEECAKEKVERCLFDTFATTEKYAELVKPFFDEIES